MRIWTKVHEKVAIHLKPNYYKTITNNVNVCRLVQLINLTGVWPGVWISTKSLPILQGPSPCNCLSTSAVYISTCWNKKLKFVRKSINKWVCYAWYFLCFMHFLLCPKLDSLKHIFYSLMTLEYIFQLVLSIFISQSVYDSVHVQISSFPKCKFQHNHRVVNVSIWVENQTLEQFRSTFIFPRA